MKRIPGKKGDEITAWLGEEVRIESGALCFEGCLRVDGQVRDGKVAGEILIVGESGQVSGQVIVDTLEVYGRLEGRVEVSTRFHLEPGATFRGELLLGDSEFTVDEGANFHGAVRPSTHKSR